MAIISIHSQVVAGHVGNSAAVFALQRLGSEVWSLPTVILSHHPSHGSAKGGSLPNELLEKLLGGLQARGRLAQCDAVISGYLGQCADALIIRKIIENVRVANPDCVYLCDPVLGDDCRTYVADDVVDTVRELVVKADIVTPNAYELSLLSGSYFINRSQALNAMRKVQSQGPGIVLLSSFVGDDTPLGQVDVMIIDKDRAWRVSLQRFDYKFHGAGDLLAAVFLHFWLPQHDTAHALEAACSSLREVLLETVICGGDELSLIAAQDKFFSPSMQFKAEFLG